MAMDPSAGDREPTRVTLISRMMTIRTPAPHWALRVFISGIAAMVAFDAVFLGAIAMKGEPGPAITALLGLSFALFGLYFVLDPVRVDHWAPYGHHNGPHGVLVLGWWFLSAGILIVGVCLVLLLARGLG